MPSRSTCGGCGATLETPLVCSACGALFSPASPPGPFAAFGLEPAFSLDAGDLRKRLLALTRRMHPDYFAGDPEQRALAERNTAELNAAHEVLADDFRRADWLVRSLGGPDENAERQMPPEFLLEVLEWNEALEAAREAPPGAQGWDVSALERELVARRAACFQRLGALLSPLPAPGAPALVEARRSLNAVRYLERALAEIAALELARPAG